MNRSIILSIFKNIFCMAGYDVDKVQFCENCFTNEQIKKNNEDYELVLRFRHLAAK